MYARRACAPVTRLGALVSCRMITISLHRISATHLGYNETKLTLPAAVRVLPLLRTTLAGTLSPLST